MAAIKSVRWPASDRNRWPASYWNAWPASSVYAVIRLAAKTYLIKLSAPFVPSANTAIKGQGLGISTLAIVPVANNIICITQTNANFSIEDMTVTFSVTSGWTSQLISWNANNLAVRRCELNGLITQALSQANTAALCFNFSTSGTQVGMIVEECQIHNWVYPFLKANTWSGNSSNIKILRNQFYNNYADDIAFNTPLGTLSDILCEGNSCTLPLSSDGSPQNHRLGISWASATQIRVVNNLVQGDYQNPIHGEQNMLDCVVANNYAEGWSWGIFIVWNNVGGTPNQTPTRINIHDNNIVNRGTASNNVGLYIVFNSTTVPSAQNSLIHHNIMNGWDIGMESGTFASSAVAVEDNMALNCGVGFQFIYPSHFQKDNISVSCTIGVIGNGGIIASHIFQSCPTPVSASAGSGDYVIIEKMTFIIPPASYPNTGYTYVPLFALGAYDMFNLTAKSTLSVSKTAMFASTDTISYGGASSPGPSAITSTRTAVVCTPGAFALDVNKDTAGANCCLLIYNVGGAAFTCGVEVVFEGQYLRYS